MAPRTYRIELTPRAERDLLAAPVAVARRLLAGIEALARDPRPRGAKKLAGERDLYRLRIGEYRVLYQVRDRLLLVLVIGVGHRREVYRR